MRSAALAGPAAGALVMTGLFAADFAGGQVGFMGMHDDRVIAAVLARSRAVAVEEQLSLLLMLVVVGALLGAAGALAQRAWRYARGRAAGRGLVWGAAAALVGHGWFLARSMAMHPQLYSEHFHERGGMRRAAMSLVIDHLPTGALDAIAGIAVALALVVPLLGARGRPLLRRHARAIGAGAGVCAVALALTFAGGGVPARASGHGKPNVLLIAVDSLRADRVYGPEASRFPALQRIAASGVRFRHAYVTQARTFASFTSLLTGRWPHHHGIRNEFPSAAERAHIGPTLPAVLHAAGYRSAAISDYSGEIFARAPYGFDEVDVPRLDLFQIVRHQILMSHASALPYASTRAGRRLFPAMNAIPELEDPERLADHAIAALDRLSAGPFFLTVFFSAPHSPYASPSPWWSKFADPRYRGPYRYLKQPLPAVGDLPLEDAAQVQALYDGAVGSVDAAIARILRRLDDDGIARDTVVVLLGDHGENLYDLPGRGMSHGDHLWGDLANRIPLVIASGSTPRDVDGIVRDVDLAPTLAALAGVTLPQPDGVDLAPLVTGARESLGLDAFEETGQWLLESAPGYRREDRLPYPDLWHSTDASADGDLFLKPELERAVVEAKVRAVVTPREKLVRQPAPDGVHFRLFDLESDPAQLHDVAAERPDALAPLRAKLDAWMAGDRP